eukprot:s1822_g2.t2
MGDAFFNLGRTCTIICTRFHEMVSVKNRWLSRGGVSPTQLVFGKMPRIPGDLPSDDHAGLMALHDALEDPLGTDQAATEFRRRMAWRCAKGRQATMAQASREAVQRAVKASTNPGSSTPVSGPVNPIFAEPREGLNLPEGAQIEILIPVYGLDDAPAAWRETVTQYLVEEEGFTRNLVERCLFPKFVPGTCTCIAQVLVEVDDL